MSPDGEGETTLAQGPDSAGEHSTTAHVRGPLRPPRLLTTRLRRARRHSSYVFRLLDVVVSGVVTLLLVAVSPGRLLEATVGQVLPYLVGLACLVGSLVWLRLYELRRHESLPNHLSRTAAATAIAGLGAVVTGWVLERSTPLGALLAWTAASLLALVALHLLWWLLVQRWRAQGWLTPNVVIVGATTLATEMVQEALEHRHLHVLGVFDDRTDRARMDDVGVPLLGTTHELLEHRIMSAVDLVVVAVDPAATSRVREITSRLAVLPNPVTLVLDYPSATERATAITRLGDWPLAPLRRVDPERLAFAKRVQDLVLAVPLLVVLSPVLVLIAAAVRLDSPGPAFFRQRRHGFNNEEIVVWKFRTMRQESADARAERQVTADDDRVTRVGRVLRKTSLDEFPQLLNVITGEMSLVGPRPHAVGMMTGDVQSAQLIAEYAHRHRIKPGVTGWAAVQGSRGPMHTPAEVIRRVELDIEYIDRHTFWLDLRIMLLTVPSVLGDRSTVR